MGEANRRRASRRPDDPLTAASRLWCGRAAGRVEEFRAPEGIIAITIDVQGASPSTLLIEEAKLVDLIDEVARYAANLDYRQLVRFIAREFARARRSNDELRFRGMGAAVVWSVLNHPDLGEVMRKGVADALRRDGRAHITWRYSPALGVAMAVSDRCVDLGDISAGAPKDTVMAVVSPRDDGPERIQ